MRPFHRCLVSVGRRGGAVGGGIVSVPLRCTSVLICGATVGGGGATVGGGGFVVLAQQGELLAEGPPVLGGQGAVGGGGFVVEDDLLQQVSGLMVDELGSDLLALGRGGVALAGGGEPIGQDLVTGVRPAATSTGLLVTLPGLVVTVLGLPVAMVGLLVPIVGHVVAPFGHAVT